MTKFDKLIQILNESVDYDDGEYPLSVVTPDEHHQYERVGGVLYELNSQADNEILYVSEIENTPENEFYEDHIERYVEYLENDGALESFPVSKSEHKLTMRELFDRLVDTDEHWDWADDIKTEFGIDYEPEEVLNEYDDMFGTNWIREFRGYGDHSWDDLDEFDKDERPRDAVNLTISQTKDLMEKMKEIIERESEIEYTLEDMNHRFEALKRIGVDRVWAEIN